MKVFSLIQSGTAKHALPYGNGVWAFLRDVLHDLGRRGSGAPVRGDVGPTPRGGQIALVGAGPGAKDLLTMRAAARLAEADVVFYDRLVDPAVLDLAPAGAERVYVGKAVGACAWPQERIDAVIVAAAKTGKRVVRLKSGDPCMFGRASEELAAARENGIPVEIVPGVTAASAAGAALGRSLTERGATDAVIFATGTCRAEDDAPDWGARMRPGTVLALYMGVRQAPVIEANLRKAGVPGAAQVEIVSDISTERERIATCRLRQLSATIRREGIGNPAIILIRYDKAPHSASGVSMHPAGARVAQSAG